jgi:phosphopantothenoylcysteine synthetase/decarboxylase
VADLKQASHDLGERWQVFHYRTFDELLALMRQKIGDTGLDAVIHSAAVSDYRAAGVYVGAPGSHFREENATWESAAGPVRLTDVSAGKVKSDAAELWLRLLRTPKLVDLVRSEWSFHGILVKFKLEVGIDDERLLQIAERSRVHSSADLMVANTLEGTATCAYLGPVAGKYERIYRGNLAERLLDEVERLHRERSHA